MYNWVDFSRIPQQERKVAANRFYSNSTDQDKSQGFKYDANLILASENQFPSECLGQQSQ